MLSLRRLRRCWVADIAVAASSVISPHLNTGLCDLCNEEVENIEHFILPWCPSLLDRKNSFLLYARGKLATNTTASQIFEDAIYCKNEEIFLQLILDPTVCPDVIAANRKDAKIFPMLLTISATWCYSMHRRRSQYKAKWSIYVLFMFVCLLFGFWMYNNYWLCCKPVDLNIMIDGFDWNKDKIR